MNNSLPVQDSKSAAQKDAAHQASQPDGRVKANGKHASANRKPHTDKGQTPPKAEPAPEKKEPPRNIQLINNQVISTLPHSCIIYVYPPLDLYYISIPDIVSETPVLRSYDTCYRYSYSVGVEFGEPVVAVSRTTLVKGNPTSVIEGFVESELWLKFFNQSTIREYSTLMDSVAMLVIRGYTGKLMSHDANLKAEAMTAAYKLRYPMLRKPIHRFLNSLASVRPLAPGYYALGGFDGPDMGPGDAKVYFNVERSLREQHYRLKCLCDDYALTIPPYYAPALTPNEILKAARKRLQNPGREDAVFHDVLYDEGRCALLLRDTAQRTLHLDETRWQSIELMNPQQILEECERHAVLKWGRKASEIPIYMKGAQVALDSDVNSEEFRELVRTAAVVKSMEKAEVYSEAKVARFIMIPSVMMRGFTHALLMNAQKRLFGSGDLKNRHSVKHMSEPERANLLKELFGTVPVANGDITSMEATVTAFHMKNIEEEFFLTLCAPWEREKIKALWSVYETGVKDDEFDEQGFYHVFGKDYAIKMAPMRLSGCEHTSAGNFVVNHTWIHAIIRMITGQYPDWTQFKLVVEGDDSLYLADVPLEDGSIYHINPEEFKKAARALGTSQKLVTYQSYTQASFCGVNLKPVVNPITQDQDDLIQWDTMWMLSKLLWTADYDPTTNKHNGELIYARALSFLPRALGNPEAYEALLYLAQRFEPTSNQMRTNHFRHIVFRTFFRGDFEEVPVLTSLEKFCQKNGYPYRRVTEAPACLFENQIPPTNMQVVKVDEVPQQSLLDIARSFFVSDSEPSKFKVEENQGRCAFYALWCYLRDNAALDTDFETWYARRAVRPVKSWRTLWQTYDVLTLVGINPEVGVDFPVLDETFFGRVMPYDIPVPIRVIAPWPKFDRCFTLTRKRPLKKGGRLAADWTEAQWAEYERSAERDDYDSLTKKEWQLYDIEYLNHRRSLSGWEVHRLTSEEIECGSHIVIDISKPNGHAVYKSLRTYDPVPVAMNNGEGDQSGVPWHVKTLVVMFGAVILFVLFWDLLNTLISIRGIPVTVAGRVVELFGSWGGLDLSKAGRTVNVIGVILVLLYKFKTILKLAATAGVLGLWSWRNPESFNLCASMFWSFVQGFALFIANGPALLLNVREGRWTHIWRLFWSISIPLFIVWQLLRL